MIIIKSSVTILCVGKPIDTILTIVMQDIYKDSNTWNSNVGTSLCAQLDFHHIHDTK